MKAISIIALIFFVFACWASTTHSEKTANNTVQQTPKKPAPKTDEGKAIYMKYCMACHQRDGSGVPGMYPPVQNADWVIGDKKRLIHAMLNGLDGEIVVNGETYNQMMPKQDFLSDKQIAQVLTFLRQNMGNKADSVKVKEVTALRKKK